MDGIKETLTPPAPNEIEVTLIGGTVGFGESILIHIGNGYWVIVDSCVNSRTGECAPLAYLMDLDVDLEKQVLYVICTHWHEDHIKGLSKILEKCSSNTVFAISCSDDREKFVYELLQDYDYKGESTKLRELTQTIQQAKANNISFKRLKQAEFIFNINGVKAYALSPSDAVVQKYEEELAVAQKKSHKVIAQLLNLKKVPQEQITEANEIEEEIIEGFERSILESVDDKGVVQEAEDFLKYKDIKKIEPNDRCVTMQVSFNNHHIILGADLENSNNTRGLTGWMAVAENPSLDGVMASLFKIPHHGSETGYSECFLKKYVKTDAVLKLTAWTKGDKVIPEKEMLNKYYSHSPELYISTTSILKKGNDEDDESIRKYMDRTTDGIYEFRPQLGIIRSRMIIDSDKDVWQTDYFGSAEKITAKHLASFDR